MTRRSKIAAGAVAAVLVVGGGISGGLFATRGSADTVETSQCYLDEAPQGRVADCPSPPDWLKDYPQATDKDNQPRPFSYQGTSWVPIIAATSVPLTDGSFCPYKATADSGDNEVYIPGCEPIALKWQDPNNPARFLTSDGSDTTEAAMQPESAASSSLAARSQMQAASLFQNWKKANPNEFTAIDNYWLHGGAVPTAATAFGQSYLSEAKAYHYAHGDY